MVRPGKCSPDFLQTEQTVTMPFTTQYIKELETVSADVDVEFYVTDLDDIAFETTGLCPTCIEIIDKWIGNNYHKIIEAVTKEKYAEFRPKYYAE